MLKLQKRPKKTIAQKYAKYCSGMPRYPVLTEPLKGETDEVRSERRKKRRKYLNAAWELLENEEAIKENRKRRILKGWNEWLKLQKSINIINVLKNSSPISHKLCDMDKKELDMITIYLFSNGSASWRNCSPPLPCKLWQAPGSFLEVGTQ